jgi:starch synthase (maltosyl-transferring)
MAKNKRSETDLPKRVIIERVSPEIDAGRFAIKRVVGEKIVVEADIFADGHDLLSGVVKFRHESEREWSEAPLETLLNDRWRAEFRVFKLGFYHYTIEAWVDHFRSWRRDLEKRTEAGQNVSVEMLMGAEMVERAAGRATPLDRRRLRELAAELAGGDETVSPAERALTRELSELMARYSDRRISTTYERELRVFVDPVRARFSAWYEMFPRSTAAAPGRHGTFKDCERHLARIAEMGFDVFYLPPIHPVGRTFRKGKNNHPEARPDEPGSPWGIGSEEGGHKTIHPELGTLEDFRHLVTQAREKFGIEIALDIAFQCSPDHPYVKEHPDWFTRRPDGTIQYAENPPKKYQDIYPLNFESPDWKAMWRELKSVFDFWIEQGVRIYRVDNPHTKALPFWEWAIGELKRDHPDLILLSEAFTRPKVMYYLAKIGFNQSYNYFPWRNTKDELAEYLTELTRTDVREFFRPNLWPNTPDILTQFLQYGGRPAFMARLILAATLGASYGIYGPSFELCENIPRHAGSEEYLNSEKYEIRHWNLDAPGNLAGLISKVNRIRKENPALQSNERLHFHPTDNGEILAYSKSSEDGENVILVTVNLDSHHTQSGWVDLNLETLGINPAETFQAHDLLTGARYLWHGPRNYVEMNPHFVPAHIFRLRRRARTEQDFDYYM